LIYFEGAREKCQKETVQATSIPHNIDETMARTVAITLAAAMLVSSFDDVNGFISSQAQISRASTNLLAEKGFFANFFEELDAFVDDATSRRLGAGSAFYGKRKSNFYGKSDKGRKLDRDQPDPTEDYQAPAMGGYFKWIQDENGQLKPVTRMKEKVVERNPNYWDKVYSEDSNQK
jgi:hypothetical protein